MISSVKEISKKGESEDTTTGIRFEIWKIAVKEIHHSWFLGVGAGDIKPVLFKDYKNKSLNGALDKNLNVHNQYLETFLGQGILGIGLLLLLLYWGILKASRTKEILNSIFVLLIILSMGPESMLNNEAGVVFIAFFYYFLFIFNLSEDEESQTIFL